MKQSVFVSILVIMGLLITACDSDSNQTGQSKKPPRASVDNKSNIETTKLQQGRQLYLKNCTVCHGINAEGAPDWRSRNVDGKFPAPPLNGTGHAWHHPKKALIRTIKDGTTALGGNMPAWKDKLSDEDIELIIMWFQSQWPPELYQAWKRLDDEFESKQTK